MKEHSSDQNNRFELRSDKVRSIVGQMPSSLVRHGIVAIGSVLVCLLSLGSCPIGRFILERLWFRIRQKFLLIARD